MDCLSIGAHFSKPKKMTTKSQKRYPAVFNRPQTWMFLGTRAHSVLLKKVLFSGLQIALAEEVYLPNEPDGVDRKHSGGYRVQNGDDLRAVLVAL